MSHFSLDDVATEGFSFELSGETFEGDKVGALFYTRGVGGDLEGAVDALLGDDAPRFWKLKPTMRQIEALVSRIAQELGSDAGKSAAPTGSRNGTAGRSTPISVASGG